MNAAASRLNPPNVLCIGRNFPGPTVPADVLEHARLEVFTKPTTALIAPGELIRLPRIDGGPAQVIAEGELTIVIGRDARDVDESHAMDFIRGFTAANDVTAMRWQTKEGTPLWMRGKGFDTFCPLGPRIVPPSEMGDLNGIRIRTFVNGTQIRQATPAMMLRSPARIVSELSRGITLAAGTVILTGGPPLLAGLSILDHVLKSGDEVAIEIDRVGRLVNRVA